MTPQVHARLLSLYYNVFIIYFLKKTLGLIQYQFKPISPNECRRIKKKKKKNKNILIKILTFVFKNFLKFFLLIHTHIKNIIISIRCNENYKTRINIFIKNVNIKTKLPMYI